ncbi:hypothetical protein [Burkholderia gladioli]|uniref:Uncharacterized protein n=2 Tax=Burkholderia gladioli TaxID=28095 RepID=A0AB38TY50_BURGA|nr:hypothetical protein [Burkholderia gladioli]MBU9277241.1 hypothetical protein [Burkholderia gladioli]UWX71548.1 hypothetical protein NYZ96_07300 [Burkholderia gladioli]
MNGQYRDGTQRRERTGAVAGAGRMSRDEMRIDVLSGRVHAQEILLKAMLDQCSDREGLLRLLDSEAEQRGVALRDSDCSLLMYAAFIEHTAALRKTISAEEACVGGG